MEVCKVMWIALLEIVLVHLAQISWCNQDMNEYRKHERRVHGYSCSAPQARSISFKDLVKQCDVAVEEFELPDEDWKVFPQMTVLHQCDSQSGCCKNADHVCAPKETENVSLIFRVVRVRHRRAAADKPRERFLHVLATNHTLCSCQAARDHIK